MSGGAEPPHVGGPTGTRGPSLTGEERFKAAWRRFQTPRTGRPGQPQPAALLSHIVTELDGIGRVLDELRGLLLGQLVIRLDRAFSDVELDELLFHLGLPADELQGRGQARTRSLVEYAHRRGRLPELLAQAERMRPGLVISGL